MNYQERIRLQEEKDRYVAQKCLEKLLYKGSDLQITPTNIEDYVDLNCSVINTKGKKIPFNVEIKERYKDEEQLQKYPNAELKVAKLKRMKQATPTGTKLLYMVLLNEKECLLFDLNKIDWSNIPLRNWRIKQTQFNPNSPYVSTPTYFIPYSAATATLDCSEYF